MRKHKRRLTLDLSGSGPAVATGSTAKRSLLTSPDVRMLKLASPELERFILQQSSLVTATPTPGGPQALSSVLAMRSSSGDATSDHENQKENSANSFVETLHNVKAEEAISGAVVACAAPVPPVDVETVSAPAAVAIDSAALPSFPRSGHLSPLHSPGVAITVVSQIPPHRAFSSVHSTADQEQLKLERKRLRNRIAATKCRHRKLERISQLEEQVEQIRRDNGHLQQLVTSLRQQVEELKCEVLKHSRSGCQITVPGFITA